MRRDARAACEANLSLQGLVLRLHQGQDTDSDVDTDADSGADSDADSDANDNAVPNYAPQGKGKGDTPDRKGNTKDPRGQTPRRSPSGGGWDTPESQREGKGSDTNQNVCFAFQKGTCTRGTPAVFPT